MTLKTDLRVQFRAFRASLSLARREEASRELFERLKELQPSRILSFASFGSEVDLSAFNQFLASQGRLALPRVNGDTLDVYSIENIDRDLEAGSFGVLEPSPIKCQKIDPRSIDLILVPGLAFDAENFRLGFGKGFYDRLLGSTLAKTIGVGFLEQKTETLLPRDSWDIPVQKLFLA